MGLVPHNALVNNGSPFVNAFQTIFSRGTWAGKLVAALAVVSGIGALNGWTLVTTEVSRAAASDGLFPQAFAWTDRKDTAWFGVVIAALLPSLLMLWRYTSSTGLTVFTELVDLTVVTVAIPYLFSACAQLTYLVSGRRRVQGWLLARDLTIAAAGDAVLAVGHLRRRLLGRVPGAWWSCCSGSSSTPSSRPAAGPQPRAVASNGAAGADDRRRPEAAT